MLLFTLNNLNRLETGLYFIGMGTLVAMFFRYEHKKHVKKGYKSFGRTERREGQSMIQYTLFTVLGYRSRGGIYFGYFFIIAGIMKIIAYFFKGLY